MNFKASSDSCNYYGKFIKNFVEIMETFFKNIPQEE